MQQAVNEFKHQLDRAVMEHRAGRLAEAALAYRRVLADDPAEADAVHLLGVATLQRGEPAAALILVRRAISLDADNPACHLHAGNCLKSLGQFAEAEKFYRAALRLRPDFADAHFNFANGLKSQGRIEAATARYRAALVCAPHYAEACCNLAIALRDLGRQDATAGWMARANRLRPDFAEARIGLATLRLPIMVDEMAESEAVPGRYRQELAELTRWGEAHLPLLGRALGSHTPFYLAYRPFDLTAALSDYGSLAARAAAAAWPGGVRRKARGDRLRLAIISGQIRHHPVWDMITRGIVEQLDRRRFELFLYHTAAETDEQTEWAKTQSARFRQGPKPIEAWLEQLAEDGPDILLYPEIGMDPTVVALAALRRAPLQVASWGHPVTSGLPTIDLFLSGAALEAEGAAAHYREKLVLLPGTGSFTAPPPDVPVAKGPASKVTRFALCQTAYKCDPSADAMLVDLAAACAPCEFWIVGSDRYGWASSRLIERLAGKMRLAGLDPDAVLRPVGWMKPDDFGAFLDRTDACLDWPSFSGYTTAWQAVHRGTPVITLAGSFLRQRLAAGLLRQIGLDEWVAATPGDYVAIAGRVAAAPAKTRRQWRDRIIAASRRLDRQSGVIPAIERVLRSGYYRAEAIAALRAGAADRAIAFFREAVDADPADGENWLHAIDALLGSGDAGSAAGLLAAARRQGLAGAGADALAASLAGFAEPQPPLAEMTDARLILAISPAHAPSLHRLGMTGRAIAAMPGDASYRAARGAGLAAQGDWSGALKCFRNALARDPASAAHHNDAGNALLHTGEPSVAATSFATAIALSPDFAAAYCNLANQWKRQAETLLARATLLRPDLVEAHNNWGSLLYRRGRLSDAAERYRTALKAMPASEEAHYNLGVVLHDQRLLAPSIGHYRSAIALRPYYPEALYNLGIASLLAGDFAAGLPLYEWRLRRGAATAGPPQPRWRGQDIAGRSIVLRAEQGLGDAIQFCRYVPLLSAMGAEVHVELPASMLPLMSGLRDCASLHARGAAPATDYHLPLLSLPLAMGTTPASIPPPVPFLVAEPDRMKRWREKIGTGGFKVGVSWQGNPAGEIDKGRSAPLAHFAAFAAVPGVRLISLQKHHGVEQLRDLPAGMIVEELGPDFDESGGAFMDCAAAIMSLDLVVTTDTAIAHLAGTLGRPVWIVLQAAPHWVWMLERGDCPWYPSARLFRQSEAGDWRAPFSEMARTLADAVRKE